MEGHESAKEAKIKLKKYKQSIGMKDFHHLSVLVNLL